MKILQGALHLPDVLQQARREAEPGEMALETPDRGEVEVELQSQLEQLKTI
jgi:hypothetical protein